MGSKKKRRRKSRRGKFDLSRGLVSVLLSIVSAVVLIAALITEAGLLYALSGLSTLATVAHVQWSRRRAENQKKRRSARPPRRPAPTMPRRRTPAPDEEGADQPRPAGPVVCTETGRGIDECDCASRHVATPEGARRYGLEVGAPMGRRKRQQAREPATKRTAL